MLLLSLSAGGCAWANRDNRPVWNAFEQHLVPEDDTLFYVALAGLMLYFRVIPRAIESLGVDSQMQPAAYVLTLVPLVLTLPWAYTKIGVVLDRFWLGRSFNTVEAVKFFLEGIQSATTSAEKSRAFNSGERKRSAHP